MKASLNVSFVYLGSAQSNSPQVQALSEQAESISIHDEDPTELNVKYHFWMYGSAKNSFSRILSEN